MTCKHCGVEVSVTRYGFLRLRRNILHVVPSNSYTYCGTSFLIDPSKPAIVKTNEWDNDYSNLKRAEA